MHFEKTCSKAKFFCGEVRSGAVARLALRFRKNISRASGGSLFCAASRAGARLRFRFSNSPAPAPARLRARVSYFQPAARACAARRARAAAIEVCISESQPSALPRCTAARLAAPQPNAGNAAMEILRLQILMSCKYRFSNEFLLTLNCC